MTEASVSAEIIILKDSDLSIRDLTDIGLMLGIQRFPQTKGFMISEEEDIIISGWVSELRLRQLKVKYPKGIRIRMLNWVEI